jgi:hypothetical protein
MCSVIKINTITNEYCIVENKVELGYIIICPRKNQNSIFELLYVEQFKL